MTLFAGSARSQSRSALNDPNCLPRPCASTAYIGELLVESGLEGQGEERNDAVAVEPGIDRVLDPSVDGASQGTAHGALERGRRVRRDEGARPGTAVHEAFVLELTVGLEHRVRVDRQLRDDLARGTRGRGLACPERPSGNTNLCGRLRASDLYGKGGVDRGHESRPRDARPCRWNLDRDGLASVPPGPHAARPCRVRPYRGRSVRPDALDDGRR